MNKAVAVMAVGLALGAVSAVSAVDLSFGGGGFFASDFGGGFFGLKERHKQANRDVQVSIPWTGGGVNVFFDAAYAEIGVGLTFAGGSMKKVANGKEVKLAEAEKTNMSGTNLNIGILGKYPVPASESITLFPAAGIDYAACLSAEARRDGEKEILDGKYRDGSPNPNEPKASDFSALWVKFGAGLDCRLSERIFLRSEILYGIRYYTEYENKEVGDYKKRALEGTKISSILGHGPAVKLNMGFKL